MIKVICFDLDGVYFVRGKENFIASLAKLGVSEGRAKEVFLESDKMNKEYKVGLIDDKEYWAWALEEWGLRMSVREVTTLMISGYRINRPAARLVKRLRNDGYKTAVCSNNFPARIEGLNRRFGFLSDFDIAVFSHEVGALKPDEKIFGELLKRSGAKAEEIVYSDDDPEKLQGARGLGIKTFVYKDFNQFCRELRRLGVSSVKSGAPHAKARGPLRALIQHLLGACFVPQPKLRAFAQGR